jgi:hypothetical protein
VNIKLEMMWKETTVPKFKLLSRNIPGRSEENLKDLRYDSLCSSQDSSSTSRIQVYTASALKPTCSIYLVQKWLKIQFLPHRKLHLQYIYQLFKAENRTKHINTLWGQNAAFLAYFSFFENSRLMRSP